MTARSSATVGRITAVNHCVSRSLDAMPLVSVVVIGYNDAQHLPTAIRSAQRQTHRDLEILVVDDASTDATPVVARRLADHDGRVKVLRLDENSGGCSRPRNVGIEAAQGRYVMFLDS